LVFDELGTFGLGCFGFLRVFTRSKQASLFTDKAYSLIHRGYPVGIAIDILLYQCWEMGRNESSCSRERENPRSILLFPTEKEPKERRSVPVEGEAPNKLAEEPGEELWEHTLIYYSTDYRLEYWMCNLDIDIDTTRET
jgi:hypothetical protein